MRQKVSDSAMGGSGLAFRLSRVLALTVAVAALGGCASQMEVTGSVPDRSYHDRHPIAVAQAPEVLYVPVSMRGGQLADADRDMIANFVASYRERGESALTVAAPSGSANEAAAAHAVGEIRHTLANLGVAESEVLYRAYQIDDPALSAPIQISYDRLQAMAGPCGYWPDDLGTDMKNSQYGNFGCATQKNFAAQIAQPRDLITPRGETPRDGGRRTTVFEKYRKGEDTATKVDNAESGKISDVGQ